MVTLGLFFLALFFLVAAAEMVTRSVLVLARAWGISEAFLGLTVVALGTSLPEITLTAAGVISTRAGIDSSQLIIGNVIGSCMAQISLIVAVAGLLRVARLPKKEMLWESVVLVLSTVALTVVAMDGQITAKEGGAFFLSYLLYMVFLGQRTWSKQQYQAEKKRRQPIKKTQPWLAVGILLFGLFLLAKASNMVLESSLQLATELGISQLVLGILLIGFGTSLPELVVSVVAAMKGSLALSVSNVVGSNILMILLVLGGSAIVTPWQVPTLVSQFDLPYLLFTTVLVTAFFLTKNRLERKESLLILALYGIFVVVKVLEMG